MSGMLLAEGLNVAYGDFQVLWDAGIRADSGEIVCLLGPNGAGKSTLMNTLSGLVRPLSGRVDFRGKRIDGLPPHRIVGEGLAHVLERRRLFPYLTVRQNLWLGGHHAAARPHRAERLTWVESLFHFLKARTHQLAHTLSGGEQQMVAIARGLMACPVCLLIDEPFLGLAPGIVRQISDVIQQINSHGITVVFIEQNVELALRLAHRGYVLESGRTLLEDSADELLRSTEVKRIFLGG